MPPSDDPLFRTLLYPVADLWSGGPGRTYQTVRFGLLSGWRVAEETSPRALQVAVLIPEMPCSVIPFAVQQTSGIRCDLIGAWAGQPAPVWRGIPCQVGMATMFANNVVSGEPLAFLVQVWLPERDPAGPRLEHVYLGMEFLTHYGFHVTLDYSSLRRDPAASSSRTRFDASTPVGFLDIH
jgi:hypothetical protein